MIIDVYALVSEDFLCRESMDGSNLLQLLDIEVALIAKDDIAPRLMGHTGLFELHDIVE